jgi:perosamine synthetase
MAGNEWAYIKECLDTNFVSSVGPFVDRFEREFASRLGAQHAVATVNGTAALHVALLVAGVEPDDEVLVSALTFIAPANAIRYAGAWPVFVDAEARFWQMDVAKAGAFLDERCVRIDGVLRNRATGRRIGAIVPVHILGHPVDMDPLLAVARTYGLPVVEDATESLGAEYRGRAVGRLADISCFSFNGNKLITTGGGGMIVTDRTEWAQRAKYLTTQAKDDPIEFVHGAIGFNYRLTNIAAAMGCAQLERVREFVETKRRIAASYSDAFADVPGLAPLGEAPWAHSAFWSYAMRVDAAVYGRDRRELARVLEKARIQTRPLWQPMHLSPAHAGAQSTGCETAAAIQDSALALPCSVGLSADEQDRVVDAVRGARREA